MTEQLLGQLSDLTESKLQGRKAYLDLWRMLRRDGYDVNFTRTSEFPRASKKRGNAYIPQETLNVVLEREANAFASIVSRYRDSKLEEALGGLSNEDLVLVLEFQVPKDIKSRRALKSEISRSLSNARLAIPVALVAQILDISHLTPLALQGHIKDGVAVPVINSLLPRLSNDSRANVALTTAALYVWEFSQNFLYTSRTTFDVWDLAAYTAGAVGVITYGELRNRLTSHKPVLDTVDSVL